jgi:hypothetical protein
MSLKFTRYEVNERPAMVLYSCFNNGYYITGYAPDTTCTMELGMPEGAPIMTGTDCIVKDNKATYNLSRAWTNECRVLVKQKDESKVSCVIRPSSYAGIDRRMFVTGLKNADVIFCSVPGSKSVFVSMQFIRGQNEQEKHLQTNIPFEELENGRFLIRNISGSLMIAWGEFEPYRNVYKWR